MFIRGLYSIFLKDWFKVIPREQFLILENGDLRTNRLSVLTQLADFLGTGKQRTILGIFFKKYVQFYPNGFDAR